MIHEEDDARGDLDLVLKSSLLLFLDDDFRLVKLELDPVKDFILLNSIFRNNISCLSFSCSLMVSASESDEGDPDGGGPGYNRPGHDSCL